MALTLRFALLAASRLGAVALMTKITMIRMVELSTAEALALGRTFHRRTQKFKPALTERSVARAPPKSG
jgi:hypothetical protein